MELELQGVVSCRASARPLLERPVLFTTEHLSSPEKGLVHSSAGSGAWHQHPLSSGEDLVVAGTTVAECV